MHLEVAIRVYLVGWLKLGKKPCSEFTEVAMLQLFWNNKEKDIQIIRLLGILQWTSFKIYIPTFQIYILIGFREPSDD